MIDRRRLGLREYKYAWILFSTLSTLTILFLVAATGVEPAYAGVVTPSNITIIKETDPDGSPQLFNFTANGGLGNFTLGDGQNKTFTGLGPGLYDFIEIVPAGWDTTPLMSCVPSANVFPSITGPSQLTINIKDFGVSVNAVCTFSNGPEQPGNITIAKETTPDGSLQLFNFTGDLGDFTLGDGQNATFTVPPGNYDIIELVPAGWNPTLSCIFDPGPFVLVPHAPSNITVTLNSEQDITCTFTNTDNRGNITIFKETIPDNSTQLFNFTGDLGNFTLGDGQNVTFTGLVPGNYIVTEIVPIGWQNIAQSCVPAGSCVFNLPIPTINVTLGENGNVTIGFVNKDIRGSITIAKETDPDGSTQLFNFTGDLGNFTLGDGQNATFTVLPGNYTILEIIPPGWKISLGFCKIDGVGSSISSLNVNGTIGLTIGKNGIASCGFTNQVLNGTVIIEKQTIPDGASGSFSFTGDITGTISDNQNITLSVFPGNYSTTETDPGPGFILSNIVCNDTNSFFDVSARNATFVVEPGEVVKCTFTNSQFITVAIDIKPGSFPNSINIKKDPRITVALFGSSTFDVRQVQVSSLRFGDICVDNGVDDGAPPISNKASYKDINKDGYLDLTAGFKTQQSGIDPGDSDACLTGNLTPSFGGIAFKGHDFIRTV